MCYTLGRIGGIENELDSDFTNSDILDLVIKTKRLMGELEMKTHLKDNKVVFADNGPYSKITVEPTAAITCQNYQKSRRNIKISCRACRDRSICLTAT